MRRPDLRQNGTLQYAFTIKCRDEAHKRRYMRIWKKGSSPIQRMFGAEGTRLYVFFEDPLRLLALAQWRSKKHRDEAFKKLRAMYPPDSIVFSDGETKTRRLGHGIQIAEVLPPRKRKGRQSDDRRPF